VTAGELKALLGLEPLAFEGGSFHETWRSSESAAAGALPSRYASARPFGTAILYLLEPGEVSRMHRVRSDEVFHFYLGDPVEMLLLEPSGAGRVITLGHDLAAGQRVQHAVPRGVWQGARLRTGGAWALMGTTVAPGFDVADFEAATLGPLLEGWPLHQAMIETLTR
jgi:predicted cupin superfamily sugar epimerase